jgi:Ca2+-binding EF-hand superfamily protein
MTTEFQKLDLNHDGVVTRAEIETAQQRAQAAAAIVQAKALFAQMDADHNGQISLDEFVRATTSATGQVNASPVLQRFDLDHNGQISLTEYRTVTLANFDAMDTDKDGVVSAAEQRAAGIIK